MKNLIAGLLFLTPAFLFGQLDRSIRPKPAAAPTINIKDSEVFKTSNGITVILSQNNKVPRVSFNLVMGASPRTEGEMAGLSEFAGSLIMSGTTNKSKDELDAAIDYIGANLSADDNSIRLSCLTKHMDKGLELMNDVLINPSFPQSEVDRIRTQYESSLVSAKADAGTMARNVVSKVNFPDSHPYGEIMTEETLANIDRNTIVEYFQNTFTPTGAYLVVVGDIDRKKLDEVVQKYFESWTGGSSYTASYSTQNLNKGARVIFVNKPGAVQSVINVTFPVDIKPGHEDYLKLTILNGILGGGVFGNRLMQNLREDKAYTYGCRSSLSVDQDGSYFTAFGNFRNEVTDSAITEILFELNRVIDELVKDEELSMTKSSMAGSFARSLESPSTVARFALNIIKNNLPKDYYQTYLKKLDAVTKEDLLAMAKKYFSSDRANIVVVGSEDIVERIKKFDADGKIERMDAFGNTVVEKIKADISADDLLNNYVKAIAMGAEGKKLAKKMKKVKSFVEVTEYKMAQAPFPLVSTRAWKKPNFKGAKMEGNGMVFQKSYFDGSTGFEFNMQSGVKQMAEDKIAANKKSVGLIPEMNYKTSGMIYSIEGIEMVDDKPCYVLKTDDGSDVSYDYFDKSTFYKVKSISIRTEGEETSETIVVMSEFKEYNGFIFPEKTDVTMGQMSLSGKVTSRTFNPKVNTEDYK